MHTGMLRILAVSLAVGSCGQPQAVTPDPSDAKSGAPAGYTLPAAGVLGLTDLANFAKLERDFVKPDDFSKGFDDSPLNGRQFAVTMPISQFSGSSSGPSEWAYDAEKEELRLTVNSGDMTSYAPFLPIQHTTDLGPKKKMNNAFGAEIEVTPMETWSIELGRGDEKPLGVFQKVEDPIYSSGYQSLPHTIRMKPDEAKALVTNLYLRLEGMVEQDERGQTVNCYSDHASATLSSPTEWDKHNCVIQVHLSRVAFVTGDGRVVREWKDEPKTMSDATAAPKKQADASLDGTDAELGEHEGWIPNDEWNEPTDADYPDE